MDIELVKNQDWEDVLKRHVMDLVATFEPKVLTTVWGAENLVHVLGDVPLKNAGDTAQNGFRCIRRAENCIAGFAFPMNGMEKYQGFVSKLLLAIDKHGESNTGYTFVNSEKEQYEQYASGDLGWQITWPASHITIRTQQYKDVLVKVIESKVNLRMLVKK